MLPPIRPLPIKERLPMVFLERGQVDVMDGAFVLVDISGVRTQIPVGGVTCLFLEPGTRITHAAINLASRTGTLILWVGEAGVRLYAAGQPGGARSDRLLYQAQLALDPKARLAVVRKMFEMRFHEAAPAKRSIDQLRGMEGVRVRERYKLLAQQFKVRWKGRRYNPAEWDKSDAINQCLSAATACLYGITEAAILAAGYAPAIGFLHSGKPLSFVYDIADLFKFDTVVPAAFRIAAKNPRDPARAIRHACRDSFRETRILRRLIPTIEEVLRAGDMTPPKAPEDAQPPVLLKTEKLGNDGHRG